jgi:AsmA protein
MIPAGAGAGTSGLTSITGIAGAVAKNGIPVAIGGTTSNPAFTPNLSKVATTVGQNLITGKSNDKQKGAQSNPVGNGLGGLLNGH